MSNFDLYEMISIPYLNLFPNILQSNYITYKLIIELTLPNFMLTSTCKMLYTRAEYKLMFRD